MTNERIVNYTYKSGIAKYENEFNYSQNLYKYQQTSSIYDITVYKQQAVIYQKYKFIF